MNAVKLARYEGYLRRSTPSLKEPTIYARLRTVRQLYEWLALNGFTPLNDLVGQSPGPTPRPYRRILNLDELKAMWAATKSDKEIVVFGLFAFCALRPEDVYEAKVEDVVTRDGRSVLLLRNRMRRHIDPSILIPEPLAAPLARYLVGRTHGPLVVTGAGNPGNRPMANNIVKKLGRIAGVGTEITALTLTFSMRAIALQHGFSFVSVVRSTGVLNTRELATLVSRVPVTPATDAGVRMARLVTSDDASTEHRLQAAEFLLVESDAPLATAGMLAGAALEAHLRAFSRMHGVEIPRKQNPTIMKYAGRLREANAIPESEVQLLANLASHRDTASHGWFEDVTRDAVTYLIAQVRAFSQRHPILRVLP